MSDDPITTGTKGGEGQPAGEPAPANPDGAKTQPTGQPDGAAASATGDGHSAEDHIFDPEEFNRLTSELPDGLKTQAEALRKSLQGSYTKKTQTLAEQRKKIEAYDSFSKNPVEAMQKFAQQFGYELKKPGAAPKQDGQPGNGRWNPESGDPSSWKDVIDYVRAEIRQEMTGEMQPIVKEFQTMRKQTIENQLTEIDPGWQQYEDKMMGVVEHHPTLAQDPAMLYRMSVPSDVLEQRATQRALDRMEAKTRSSQVGGASTTTKKPTGVMPSGPISFQEAVKLAKRKLNEEGIHAP